MPLAPFEVEIVRLTDAQDSVWRLSFLERRSIANTNVQMASTKLHRGPDRRVCQFAHGPSVKSHKPQTQFVAESRFFLASVRHCAIDIITKTTIKNNNADSQKLTSAGGGAQRGRGRPHRFHVTERRDKEPAGSIAPLLASDRAQSPAAIPVACRSSREREC
jgi:hypothetical protein